MKNMVFRVSLLVCALLILPTLGMAQAQVASGDVKGTVFDPSGAVVPGAQVTIFDAHTGFSRTMTTDSSGFYHFLLLPPTSYEVRVEAAGFGTQKTKEFNVTVGQALILDFRLTPSTVATEVVVTTELPLVETERTQQSETIEERLISNLPINRRNFLDFALLTPGVLDSDSLADNTDFRVTQTPQSGLSFGGNNGRGNSVTVDGAENNYNSGGVRPTISQEAVQEFQVNRSSYAPEFGGGSGGIVNIVSKGGTNDFHGSIFGYLRNRKLDARNSFDLPGVKSPFTRAQYGASGGGPIRKDRSFFFASFERLDQHESKFVPINRDPSFLVPTPNQTTLLNTLAAIPPLAPLLPTLRGALTPGINPAVTKLIAANNGTFPFSAHNSVASLRIDHRFSSNNTAFFRENYSESFSPSDQFGALIAVSRGKSIEFKDNNILLADSHIFSANLVNEFRFNWGYTRYDFTPTDPNGPEFNLSGFGFFNRDIFLPSHTTERRYQWSDNLTHTRGRHSIKTGIDYILIREASDNETFFGGRFNFSGNTIPFAALLGANAPAVVGALTAAGRSSLIPMLLCPSSTNPLCTPLTPNAALTSLQSFSIGLPTVYQQGFGTTNDAAYIHHFNIYLQDSWKVRSNFLLNYGLRYELDAEPKPLNRDTNNFGPRFGFSWDPWSNGKTSIRGGYGIFYSPINYQIPNVVRTLDGVKIAQTFVTLSNPGVNSAVIFQTLRAQGVIGSRTIRSSDLAQFGIRPGPNAPFSVLFPIDPHFVNSYTQQGSLGIDREVTRDFSVSVNYVFTRGLKITRAREINIFDKGTKNFNGSRAFGFFNPLIFQNNIYESSANSFYHAVTFMVTKRMSHHFMLNAHYTFSKTIDEVTDFNSDFEANDQLNLRADRGLSAFHQAHRFVFNGVFEAPWRAGRDRSWYENLLGDWTFSPIFIAGSGRPFNLLASLSDINGDRHPNTDRPFGAGRNTGRGPDFISADFRLARRLRLDGEGRKKLDVIFEFFNVFNRLNYKAVNNQVNPFFPGPFNVAGVRGLLPTSPLGFTDQFDPRQIQVALRFTF